MKKRFTLPRCFGRGTVMTVLSVLVLVGAFLLGIGADALKQEWNSYIDMTPEGLYTLTDTFLEEVSGVTDEVTVTFCADPDVLLSNESTRYVYIMAREIERQKPNVKVVTCNVRANPTAVQQFRTTSSTVIDWNHVIVSSGQRYRTLVADAFWSVDSTTEEYFAFNGEYKMASAMLSITAVSRPVAYFAVGHGERVYDPTVTDDPENERLRGFWQLLRDVGLEVGTVDLDREEIPSDCALLVLNDPTEDYAIPSEDWFEVGATSALERIDRYLDDIGSLMVFKDPEAALPTLEEYLTEWGIAYQNGVTVKGPRGTEGDEDVRDRLLAVYPQKETDPIGYSLFGDVAGLATAPQAVIPHSGYLTSTWIDNSKLMSVNVSAMTSAVFYSAADTRAYDTAGALVGEEGSYALARMTAKLYTDEVKDYYSYVFCAASTEMIETAWIENPTYANYDVLFSTVRSISRTDEYASDALGGLNMNSQNFGGKRLVSLDLGATEREVWKDGELVYTYLAMNSTKAVVYTVLLLLPSLVLCGIGIYCCVRRKHR
ncbi:MAG: Gldg family protein [Clostridia bacterium]|nr:Gldg family protein [Clostridia bacterium]